MESEKSGFTNETSEIWRKMQVKRLKCETIFICWKMRILFFSHKQKQIDVECFQMSLIFIS